MSSANHWQLQMLPGSEIQLNTKSFISLEQLWNTKIISVTWCVGGDWADDKIGLRLDPGIVNGGLGKWADVRVKCVYCARYESLVVSFAVGDKGVCLQDRHFPSNQNQIMGMAGQLVLLMAAPLRETRCAYSPFGERVMKNLKTFGTLVVTFMNKMIPK